jgi:hypothetical protein
MARTGSPAKISRSRLFRHGLPRRVLTKLLLMNIVKSAKKAALILSFFSISTVGHPKCRQCASDRLCTAFVQQRRHASKCCPSASPAHAEPCNVSPCSGFFFCMVKKEECSGRMTNCALSLFNGSSSSCDLRSLLPSQPTEPVTSDHDIFDAALLPVPKDNQLYTRRRYPVGGLQQLRRR